MAFLYFFSNYFVLGQYYYRTSLRFHQMVINNLLPDAEVTTYGIDGIMTTVYRSAAAALLGSHRTET